MVQLYKRWDKKLMKYQSTYVRDIALRARATEGQGCTTNKRIQL